MKILQKVHSYLRKVMIIFLKIFSWGSCFASVQLGKFDLMDIPKPVIKCCRWYCKINIIVLIWVFLVFLFHKCLRLLCLGLYTILTLCVNNDAAIVAHICYISLLRCNYYHEYLACVEEDICERYILLEGDGELLPGERSVIFWKIA